MLTWITWLRYCLTGFSTPKLLYSPIYTLFLRNKSLSTAHYKVLPKREGSAYVYYLKFFYKKDVSLPAPLIYSNIYLYKVWNPAYVFYIFYVFVVGRIMTPQICPHPKS